ncbi:MAG: response regulator transcription factor [Bacteroidales bacterium]|nr:response regulator transcription factor [Bacteroidales bacterium]
MQKKIKILLAEDDPNLGDILKTYLEAKGYQARLCVNGQKAFEAYKEEDFDFCIIDVMMPVKDGFSLVKDIRSMDEKIPILFLTAKAMQEDKLKGFKIGADDYLTKPFSMEELLMRIKAILHRTNLNKKPKNKIYKIGEYTFDYNQYSLSRNDNKQKLTSKEAELLRLLCENKNDVLTRTLALNKIWKDDSYFNARSMDVYIVKLRKYLKEDPKIKLLNIHGIGFKLNVEE